MIIDRLEIWLSCLKIIVIVIFFNSANAQWNQLGFDIPGVVAGDWCGHGSVISDNGNRIAAGSIRNSEESFEAGHVRVFEYDGVSWVQIGSNILGEREDDHTGHMTGMDMDTSGNILAIGSALNSDGGESAGHVRVFEFIDGDWAQMGTDIDGLGIGWTFGQSMSLSDNGSILAIGTVSYDSDLETDIGAVFLYEYDGLDWVQIGSEVIGDIPGDGFGGWVTLNSDGTMFATASAYNDEVGENAGKVQVYAYELGEWVQVGEDIFGDDDDDFLGRLCLSGDGSILATACYSSSTGGYLRGKVKVFEFVGGSWVQLGSDLYGDSNSDFFGISLDMSSDGSTIVAGAYGNDVMGIGSGQAKVFKYFDGDWNLIYSPIYGESAWERTGNSTSISSSGTKVCVGGPTSNVAGYQSGVVRVFEMEPCGSSEGTIFDTVCHNYTVPSGDETYESSGVYMDTIFNSCGGDSVLTINVTIIEASYTNVSVFECESYTSPSGDSTYLSSTEIIDTINTIFGCDSILFIELLIGNNFSEFSIMACDSFEVPSGDEVYTESGTYMDTISNISGCDSVMTINLSIGNSESYLIESACFSYVVPSADEMYTESGIYQDTIPNINGCDSLITIDLTINGVEAEITYSSGTFIAGPDLLEYQWINCDELEAIIDAVDQSFSPLTDGEYAVIVSNDFCSDTSECMSFSSVSWAELEKVFFTKIHPNPFNDYTIVDFGEELIENYVIKIHNTLGQEVYRNENVTGSQLEIKKEQLGVGIFLLTLYNSDFDQIYTAKLVVN